MTIVDKNLTSSQFPSAYTDGIAEKSNLLLRANVLEAQHEFDEAAELFAASARLEAKLAKMARQVGRMDIALVHLVSEMSCWAAAGDTYRALAQGRQILALSTLSSEQRSQVNEFMDQLNDRRRAWMEKWSHAISVAA